MRWRSPFLIAAIVLVLTLLIGLVRVLATGDEPSAYVLTVAAGLMATFGWMYTNEQNLINARNQYTVNLLFQSRFSEFLHKLIKSFDFRLSVLEKSAITPDLYVAYHTKPETMNDEDRDFVFNARSLLSYYEYIALMIRKKILDEELCYETIGTASIHVYTRCSDMVRFIRGEIDERGNETGRLRYPKAFENLIWWSERVKEIKHRNVEPRKYWDL